MSELTLERVSETFIDVLREIGNIGAGNAMTALSQMLQCKIDMYVPQVKLLEFSEVGSVMGSEEDIMVGVYLAVEGDISGSMMFLSRMDTARYLVDKVMMGMSLGGPEFTDMEKSAMQEIGNIITGAYLNAISSLTNLKIFPSPPELTIDMAGAILSVPAIEFGSLGDKLLLIQSHFHDEVERDGFFILIPDLDSYGKILQALGLSLDAMTN